MKQCPNCPKGHYVCCGTRRCHACHIKHYWTKCTRKPK